MASKPPRILILDDDPAHASLMKFYFEEEGYKVDWASNSAGFIDIAANMQPDAIVLDTILPDCDGFVIGKDLLADARTKAIPIVFVTVREAEKARGLAMGAKAFVSKPFREDELKSAMKTALNK